MKKKYIILNIILMIIILAWLISVTFIIPSQQEKQVEDKFSFSGGVEYETCANQNTVQDIPQQEPSGNLYTVKVGEENRTV